MMHDLEFATESLDEMELDAPRSDQQEVLQELYESSELLNEGLLSFEYPLFIAEDEELDLFLGKLIRRAGKLVQPYAPRFSVCANKHGRKVRASSGEHEQMPDKMGITQPLVREK